MHWINRKMHNAISIHSKHGLIKFQFVSSPAEFKPNWHGSHMSLYIDDINSFSHSKLRRRLFSDTMYIVHYIPILYSVVCGHFRIWSNVCFHTELWACLQSIFKILYRLPLMIRKIFWRHGQHFFYSLYFVTIVK